ncbi:MAG: MarR family transcriptional regulator [Nitrospirae bacterium]|nr:MarR family transcriptional regulator [Nitrospirota bacterium]MBI3594086.1 MarR family transcriptional regulator [Nitrospirota bacterium]
MVRTPIRKSPGPVAPPKESPLESLINETVALFYRLRVVAEQIHQQGETSGPKRGLLKNLERLGPQTVPQMARIRPVSRQYIQTIVSQLHEGGYVTYIDNPAHKRSPLVKLNQKGQDLLKAMSRQEDELLSRLKISLPAKELNLSASMLRKVRLLFESAEWEHLVQGDRPKR